MLAARTPALVLGVLVAAAACGTSCGGLPHTTPAAGPGDVHLATTADLSAPAAAGPGSGAAAASHEEGDGALALDEDRGAEVTRDAAGAYDGLAAAPSSEASDTWPAAADTPGGARLEAARTVALYCRLIETGRFARASELCTHRRLWSRRAYASTTRFHFRSARIYAAPDARTLVLATRVRVHARRGGPPPDGLVTLFFTLGRVGSAVGGWLITAISASP